MKKYYYGLTFSPYSNFVRAKNRKEAWRKIKRIWSEYNIKEVATLY